MIRLVGSPENRSAMIPIIGFKTVDNYMVYYECQTDYTVYPIVGKDYGACVGGIPYGFTDEIITKIRVIW